MKVYQFNTATGVYTGELFEDESRLEYLEGVTTVAPPSYGTGEVPVFDSGERAWRVLSLPERTPVERGDRLVPGGQWERHAEERP